MARDDQERFNALWAAKEELGEGSTDLLLQAKALVLCALPYKRIAEQQLTRTAKLGRDTTLSVTFAAIGKDAVLPYGADRALLGWIQTRAYSEGFISFEESAISGSVEIAELSGEPGDGIVMADDTGALGIWFDATWETGSLSGSLTVPCGPNEVE